ncbi:MAG: carboxypeptidase-like regulatory domain-containing protein [Cyanobacteria bacterium]|nr:carboxypeptidase-like regulatory domain-containing protein [Cyanobacteriota bacterium]
MIVLSWFLRAAMLLAPLAGSPLTVTGTVIDPQRLPIADARIVITCAPADPQHGITDHDGRFELSIATSGPCLIDVAADGFSAAHLAPPSLPAPLIIQLEIAAHIEAVTVAAKPARPRRSLFAVSLDADSIAAVAGSTSGLIRHASGLAGAAGRPLIVYVDGLPASTLPPIANVEHISVDAGRFSAEYADAGAATVRIFTRTPGRGFRVRSNSDLLGLGGRQVLADGARTKSTQRDVTLTGGVPKLAAGFDATVRYTSSSAPVEFVSPEADEVTADTSSLTAGLTFHVALPHRTRAAVSYRDAQDRQSNLGAGGLTTASAAYAARTNSGEWRATVLKAAGLVSYEGGATALMTRIDTKANSDAAGITIGGGLTTGGAPVTTSATRSLRWSTRHAFRFDLRRSIDAGVAASGRSERWSQMPNRYGWWQFDSIETYRAALEGEAAGTRFIAASDTTGSYSSITVAPYLQATLFQTAHSEWTAGLRADYQSGLGVAWLPRVAVAIDRGGTLWTVGAGLFAGSQAEQVRSALSTRTAVVTQAGDTSPLTARVSPAFSRPRTLMTAARAERQFGAAAALVEYSLTRDRRLPGSTRTIADHRWVDIVESNRAATTHRLSVQVQGRWRRQFFSAQYERIRAFDDHDGPFSFPEEPGNLRAEWAPAAGVSPHNVTLMATLALPGAVSIAMTDTWRGPAPFNITTGLDRLGNGLMNDRGGRPRNAGRDQGYHTLGAYGSRSFKVWKLRPRLGVQAENLLNVRNVLSVGRVVGAPGFGQPLAMGAGRSVRVFASWF